MAKSKSRRPRRGAKKGGKRRARKSSASLGLVRRRRASSRSVVRRRSTRGKRRRNPTRGHRSELSRSHMNPFDMVSGNWHDPRTGKFGKLPNRGGRPASVRKSAARRRKRRGGKFARANPIANPFMLFPNPTMDSRGRWHNKDGKLSKRRRKGHPRKRRANPTTAKHKSPKKAARACKSVKKALQTCRVRKARVIKKLRKLRGTEKHMVAVRRQMPKEYMVAAQPSLRMVPLPRRVRTADERGWMFAAPRANPKKRRSSRRKRA